jgi:UTP-glucose-1-phosphate uridylyltransferase
MIKQAIIPLAGQGTRLLPLTSVFAKELLPINGKPGIEYILDECIEAGIKEVVFIISNKKKMIKNYFYSDTFYEKIIKKKKDPRIIAEYKKILKYKKLIKFVYQNIPKGTGDAVFKTRKHIKDKYFLMLLPDDLIIKKNCSKDMIKQAIIPLAGQGTRLLPLTSVFAKELLPINGKPGIEYILDECIEAGIKEVVFIISNKKKMIKNYFYSDNFYKKIIKKKKDSRIIAEYKKILKYKKIIKFVYQNIPKGTGDAVFKTRKYIKDKYFLMLLPDDLIIKKKLF